MARLVKILSNSFKLATSDIANQYALPVKSMTGNIVSKYGASKSMTLNERIIDKLDVKADDYIFEIGYGRGDAIKMCYDKISNGNGMVFGVERSGYMDEKVRKRFILEIAETGKIRIDSAIDLRNLPYPTDLFNHIFHVDLFYFLKQEHLTDINRELLRVLKPGSSILCGMQFDKLKQLTDNNILDETQWDPLRYLTSLEDACFQNVQINYYKDDKIGEYQIISAQKPRGSGFDEDPEEMMKKLALDIKRERLEIAMRNNKKDTGVEE